MEMTNDDDDDDDGGDGDRKREQGWMGRQEEQKREDRTRPAKMLRPDKGRRGRGR